MFKKEAIFVTFRVWLYEKQLGSIRELSLSRLGGCPSLRDLPNMSDMSNPFCFHFVFMIEFLKKNEILG